MANILAKFSLYIQNSGDQNPNANAETLVKLLAKINFENVRTYFGSQILA